ncbi:hypothetical protein, partial [Coleofasciculus sp. G2-EDA-02]|uniref:hypothetical protein n=1 Tax=Coleofasciculus sp. G2-EDA-02 TaxID=3069529 RepID=UPI0032F42596
HQTPIWSPNPYLVTKPLFGHQTPIWSPNPYLVTKPLFGHQTPIWSLFPIPSPDLAPILPKPID